MSTMSTASRSTNSAAGSEAQCMDPLPHIIPQASFTSLYPLRKPSSWVRRPQNQIARGSKMPLWVHFPISANRVLTTGPSTG